MKISQIISRVRARLTRRKGARFSPDKDIEVRKAIGILKDARKVAVLTGAGMSAESGISTFRSKKGGVWKSFDPSEVATPEGFRKNPIKVLAWHQEMRRACQQATPNAGHYAIAKMQELFPEVIVLTQNIDGLHQRAGSHPVFELHGDLFRMKGFCDSEIHTREGIVHCPVCHGCTSQRSMWRPEYKGATVEFSVIPTNEVPRCPHCAGPLRPDIVWFNEDLDPYLMDAAWNVADSCDVLLVVGTSLQVQPVSAIPWRAAYKGAKVIEVNPEPSEATGFWSVRIKGSAAEILPVLTYGIQESRRSSDV